MASEVPVSVLLPSYNYAHYLPLAIESVVKQRHSLWELIIVDDGSTDDSRFIAESFAAQDSRIRFLCHPDGGNHGLASTLLRGLSATRYDYIAFLEADDTWEEGSLEQRLPLMCMPGTALVFNSPRLLVEKGRNAVYYEELNVILEQVVAKRSPAQVFAVELFAMNLVPCFSCVLADRSMLLTSDFSSPTAPLLDKWLWQQMALKGMCRYLAKPLTHWRLHSESYIAREYKTESAAERSHWHERSIACACVNGPLPPSFFIYRYLPDTFCILLRVFIKTKALGTLFTLRALARRISEKMRKIIQNEH